MRLEVGKLYNMAYESGTRHHKFRRVFVLEKNSDTIVTFDLEKESIRNYKSLYVGKAQPLTFELLSKEQMFGRAANYVTPQLVEHIASEYKSVGKELYPIKMGGQHVYLVVEPPKSSIMFFPADNMVRLQRNGKTLELYPPGREAAYNKNILKYDANGEDVNFGYSNDINGCFELIREFLND